MNKSQFILLLIHFNNLLLKCINNKLYFKKWKEIIEREILERKRLENKINEKLIKKKEKDVKNNSEGDLAVVLFNFNGITLDELNIRKDEYLIVTNWNIGDGYAYGYKRNDPQNKGKFPPPLVRKCSKKEGIYIYIYKPSFFEHLYNLRL